MLTEATIASTDKILLVRGRDKLIPTLAATAPDIKTGPFVVYLISPAKVKATRYTDDWNPVVRFINAVNTGKETAEIDRLFQAVSPDIVTRKEMSKEQLRKYLTTKSSIKSEVLVPIFGKESPDEKVNGVGVSGLSNLSIEKKKSFDELISLLNVAFSRHGVEDLSNTPIHISPIKTSGSGVPGLFYPDYGHVQIDPTRPFNDKMVKTLFHEYGHAWYFLHMTADQRQQVKEFFSSLDQSDHQASIDVKVGDFVRYIGKKHTLRAGNDYVISGHKGSLYGLVPVMGSFTHRGKEYSGFSANIGALAGGEWEKEVEVNGKREWVLIREESSSEWFPSDYSKKNHEEWWAEMFAAFMEDRLGEEQSAWIKQYLA